jgi:hypothetical protein
VEDRIEALDQQMTLLRGLHESVRRPGTMAAAAGHDGGGARA